MADNAKDATSSAPGTSSVSTKNTGEAPTSDSKVSSPGITPATPQPASSSSDASPPTIRPNQTNNPKPVSNTEQAASIKNEVAPKDEPPKSIVDQAKDSPRADEDWDKPEETDPSEIYDALRAALTEWADNELDQGEDDNPHYARHRNLERALDEGALSEASGKLHEVSEIIASHLNGGR